MSRIKLSDLSPGVTYAIQVRANDGSAVSQWSRSFNITTTSDTLAPKTPTSVVGSMTGTAFNLSWAKVTQSSDNSPAYDLDHYDVKVESAGTAVTKTYATSDTKFMFTLEMNRELFGTPRANIKMSVSAVDKVGNPSAFSAVVDQTNAAPANPTGLTAVGVSDAVVLTWTGVSDADLSFYRVYSGTTSGSQTTVMWSGLSTTATIPSTLYTSDRWYKVVAVDVFGTESPSGPVAGPVRPNSPFVTDANSPAIPTGLSAALSTSTVNGEILTSAVASWNAVTDTDGDLAGYKVGYRSVGSTEWSYVDVDYTNTSVKIDRLTPYVEYEFRVRSYDFSANYSNWSGTYTTATAEVNTAPSTPAAPTAASATQRIQVTISGNKAAGGAMESDVRYYEVYASAGGGAFTANSTTMVGTIPVGPAMIGTFSIPTTGTGTTQTWWVKIIAVDALGLKSAASAAASATPGLILTANIGDAQITNAKINDLGVDKLIAGTGVANDFTIKSTLTMGDASTVGAIQSYDYITNTSGWKVGKGVFEVNNGLIQASALKLQSSPNLVPPQFADFEYTNDYYVSSFWRPTGQGGMSVSGGAADGVVGVAATDTFKGKQRLSVDSMGSTSTLIAYFGRSSTDYNIDVEPGKTYIWSAYIQNRPANTQSWTVGIYGDNGNNLVGSQAFVLGAAEPGFVRRSFAVTIPAGTNRVLVRISKAAGVAAAIYMDGMQFEEKTGATDEPSAWKPPGSTIMDGSGIVTGMIKANSNVLVSGVSMPAWSINTAGNAQFGDALVRGKLLIGTGADVYINKAPNNGNFETTGSGYTLYHTGATSPAITRTTTNPISGVGSLIATSAAGSKTQLGIAYSIAAQSVGTAVRVGANVRVNATNAGSTIRVNFMSGTTVVSDIMAYSEPRSGETNAILAEYVVEAGYTIDGIRIFHDGTLTTTQFMIDDITTYVDSEIGPSYIASSNYVRNTSGWKLDSLGNLEANQGDFRGTLRVGVKGEQGALDGDIIATGTISGDKFAGTVVVASLMTSSEDRTQQRWEAGGEGIKLYGPGLDAPAMISLPTDPNSTASFRGDVETNSLIVNDNMAIRGLENEISKSSKLLLSTGTTKPSSPPTAYNSWEQYDTRRYAVGSGYEGFDKGRWGLAKPTSNTNFYYAQVLYGANSKIQAISSTGAQVSGIDWQTGVRNGNTFAIGDTICIFGWKADKTAWVEKYNLSGVKTSEVQLSGVLVTDWVNYAATYDGTNILMFSSNHGYSGKSRVYKYNATTGAYVGYVELGATSWNGVAVAAGNFDFGTPVIIVGYEESSVFRVHNATTGAELSQHNFPVVGNNKRIGGITWDGSRFWSHNNDLMLLARHSTLTWDNTKSGTMYYGMTWYASGSGHETQISARRTIGMYKRARLRFDIPRVPDDPSGTDLITAAKIYLARSTSASSNVEPANSVFQLQGSIVNPATAGVFDVNIPTTPVSGDAPPTVNTFTASAPAQILSTENVAPNILLKGDGTGNVGPMDLNTIGKVKFGSGGSTISQVRFGRAALQTDASGNVTITHGLGVAPSMIMARLDGTASYDVGVTGVNTTTFTATIYASNNPATRYNGNLLPISWIAIAA